MLCHLCCFVAVRTEMRICCGFPRKKSDLWLDLSQRVKIRLCCSHVNPVWLLNERRVTDWTLSAQRPSGSLTCSDTAFPFFCQCLLHSTQPGSLARGREETNEKQKERAGERESVGEREQTVCRPVTTQTLRGHLRELVNSLHPRTPTHPCTLTHSHTQVWEGVVWDS